MNKAEGNIITASDVVKYSRCGGYHGNRGLKTSPQFDVEETCFGMYMYLLDNTFLLRTKTPEQLQDKGLNAQINKLVGAIEQYVMNNCVSDKNKVVFNEREFKNQFSGSSKSQLMERFKSNSALMPYVIQYVLMQNGIEFSDNDRNIILKEFGLQKGINGVSVVRKKKHVTMAKTKESVDRKREDFEDLGK